MFFQSTRPENSPSHAAWLVAFDLAAGAHAAQSRLSEIDAPSYLENLFLSLQADAFPGLKRVWLPLQNHLMARREGTFEEIQLRSPFQPYAQKNLNKLYEAFLNGGHQGVADCWQEMTANGLLSPQPPLPPIRLIPNTGDSEETAIELTGASDVASAANAEWWFKYFTYGYGWSPGSHFRTAADPNGLFYSVHAIYLPDQAEQHLYFRRNSAAREVPKPPADLLFISACFDLPGVANEEWNTCFRFSNHERLRDDLCAYLNGQFDLFSQSIYEDHFCCADFGTPEEDLTPAEIFVFRSALPKDDRLLPLEKIHPWYVFEGLRAVTIHRVRTLPVDSLDQATHLFNWVMECTLSGINSENPFSFVELEYSSALSPEEFQERMEICQRPQ